MAQVELKEKNRQAYQKLGENLTPQVKKIPIAWHLPLIFSSSAIVALLFFAAIDLCLRFSFHPDLYQLPDHNFIWWSVSEYRKLKQAPETLIFGSSLMVAVTDYGDATYLNSPIDSATHHQSMCLANNLYKQTGDRHSNFSFAVGGQMASDVYAIERTLIQSANCPRLIIWGIAPRDFVDTAFREPLASSTAQYMNRISQKSTIVAQHTSLPYYIEKALGRISKVFASKQDFVCIENAVMQSLVKELINNITCRSTKNITAHYGPTAEENLEIGDRIVQPCQAPPDHLIDNTKEYKARYNPFRPEAFNLQLKYCERFLNDAKTLGVKVLFVNMPITSGNMKLMPPGLYNLYLSKIRQIAQSHAAKFYDFNTGKLFSEKDFSDSVHLNGIGGKTFVELLSSRIKSDHILQ